MADTRLKERSFFDPEIMRPAIWESFRKLAPQKVIKNPVMFVVEIGSVITTLIWLRDLIAPTAGSQPLWFTFNVAFWLWFTVVFANFAEAVAEGRGKAQAATLRKMRKETIARRLGTENVRKAFRRHHCAKATWLSLKRVRSSRAMAKSLKASPRSMNRRLPASPHRSFAKVAATVPP